MASAGPGHAGASRELRVLNFAAKFLCIRQVAVSTTLGQGVEDGGSLVPTSEWARTSLASLRSAGLASALPGARPACNNSPRGLRGGGGGGRRVARLWGTESRGQVRTRSSYSACASLSPSRGRAEGGGARRNLLKTHAGMWGRQGLGKGRSPSEPLAREPNPASSNPSWDQAAPL